MEPADLEKLGAYFTDLGIQPNLTSKEDFKKWMDTQGGTSQVKKEEKDSVEKGHDHHGASTTNRPRLPNFSGAQEKDSTPYEVWRYELNCIMDGKLYSQEMISETIRRSLKGEAAKVLVRMGPKASNQDMVSKMDGLYGLVATEGSLLSQFYAATQKEDVNVSDRSLQI